MEENNEPIETPENNQQQPPPPPQYEAGPVETEPIETDKNAKLWAMLAHLSAFLIFLSIPFANIAGPLIIWLTKKDQMPFVDNHAKESLNFQISIIIYFVIALSSICIGIGVILIPAVAIFNVVFVIIAAIKANEGMTYRYPLCIRFIK